MHTTPLQRWLAGITLLAVVLFSAFLWLKPLLSIGGGYAAKQACSCHFLQGRALEEISEHDLNFSVLGWYGLEANDNRITSSFFGLAPRTAVYVPGLGCTLLNGDAASAPPSRSIPSHTEVRNRLQTIGYTVPSYWNEDSLRIALDYALQPVPGGVARGIAIFHRNRLITEAYGEGFFRTTPLPGWSMTKTLTGLALGAYLAQDSSLDAVNFVNEKDNLFPELWRDKRAEITLADLLRMNSGLEWNEGYGSITDATVMLHEKTDFAEFAARHQLAEEPGTVWNYSSGTTNILMEYLREQLGSNEALYRFLDSLFTPIAPSLIIEPDQSGRPVGSSYGWATAQDWANLGQFMLQDGVWNGDTLLPPGWIDFMREPATGSDGVYGAQTWLPGPDVPSLPADAYMMRGFQDQRVFIIPSKQLVIARLGHGDDKVTDFEGLISRILAALE